MGIAYRIVMRAAGAASALIGIAMASALAVSLFFREYREAAGFAFCLVVTLLFAGALYLLSRPRAAGEPEPKPRDAMLIVTVWWVTSSVFGGLPYMACGVLGGPADAVFESVSGFTTTGATILGGLPALPRGVLLWRSVTGWLGGLEILAASLAMLPPFGAGHAIAQIESAANLSERPLARERGAALRLCAVYAGGTALLFLLLCGAATKPFDAVLLTLGAVSSSGFSSHAGGMVEISGAAAFFLCVFMLHAAVNFTLRHRFFARRNNLLLRDEELRWFFLIFCCAAVVIALYLLFAAPRGAAAQNVGNAFFEAASALSTTGYHRETVFFWPPFCRMLLLFLMLTGGCAASAAGGMKVGRLIILFRLLRRNISIRLHPNAVLPIKFGGRAVPTDTVNAIAAHAMLCVAVFFIATTILCFDGAVPSAVSVFGVLACMSNAGPAVSAANPAFATAVWAAYSPPAKLFLSFLMILGRLEFTTVLLLFTPRYWKND
ncbi:MAG: TrkH family potassium uptake protein [Clostridiales Family XIII bacterium]|jgi:trk system potassium uptake protein TrkH|nr:TrkH family potassium uptake protein [Clostridiales Family XIII bacterium]